jgi:hypothetical protein
VPVPRRVADDIGRHMTPSAGVSQGAPSPLVRRHGLVCLFLESDRGQPYIAVR